MSLTNPTLIEEQLTRNNWGLLGSQGYVVGVDLGGYGLRVAVVNLQHHTCTSTHADLQGTTPREILDEALGRINTMLAEAGVEPRRLVRIGVGISAPVDPHRGVVMRSPRMREWENVALKDYFEQALDTVTLVDNDANLIALSESTFGGGRECQHLVYIHLSSGVGGGIVLGGRLHHGATAIAGEIGHTVIEHSNQEGGKPATLEACVSIDGLLRRAGKLGLATTNLNDIFRDDPIGQQVVRETVHILALRLAHIVALLDPEMIVLGGIVARIGGDSFINAIATHMNTYIDPALTCSVKVVPAMLGTDSIAIGALALALDSLRA